MFLYSATLTLPALHKKKSAPAPTADEQLDKLVDQVGVSPKAKVVDLSSKHVTAKKLKQVRIFYLHLTALEFLCMKSVSII